MKKSKIRRVEGESWSRHMIDQLQFRRLEPIFERHIDIREKAKTSVDNV